MIIVLEGPDFAGKSTIAQRLMSQHRGGIVANGPPPPGVILADHYLGQVRSAARRADLTVFDRLHVGELIYGPIYRGRSQLSSAQVSEIEHALDAVGALKFHVDEPDAVLLERLAGPRGDDVVKSPGRLLTIAAQYRDLLSGTAPFSRWRPWDGRAESLVAARCGTDPTED